MDPMMMQQLMQMLRGRMQGGAGQPQAGGNLPAQNARFGATLTQQEQQAAGGMAPPAPMAPDPYNSELLMQKLRQKQGVGGPPQPPPNAFRQFQQNVQGKVGSMVDQLRKKMPTGLDAYRLHSQEAQAGIADPKAYKDWVQERQ